MLILGIDVNLVPNPLPPDYCSILTHQLYFSEIALTVSHIPTEAHQNVRAQDPKVCLQPLLQLHLRRRPPRNHLQIKRRRQILRPSRPTRHRQMRARPLYPLLLLPIRQPSPLRRSPRPRTHGWLRSYVSLRRAFSHPDNDPVAETGSCDEGYRSSAALVRSLLCLAGIDADGDIRGSKVCAPNEVKIAKIDELVSRLKKELAKREAAEKASKAAAEESCVGAE